MNEEHEGQWEGRKGSWGPWVNKGQGVVIHIPIISSLRGQGVGGKVVWSEGMGLVVVISAIHQYYSTVARHNPGKTG